MALWKFNYWMAIERWIETWARGRSRQLSRPFYVGWPRWRSDAPIRFIEKTQKEADRFPIDSSSISRRIMNQLNTVVAAVLIAILGTSCRSTPSPPAAAQRRNIIVIVADDLGYADIGVQGQSKDVRTPNIDELARGGVRFTNGYVSCPVCSPTRAGLLTGRYQQRFGHEMNPGPPPAAGFGLPLDQVVLPVVLKKAGYAHGDGGEVAPGDGGGVSSVGAGV
jgi:hypothetical protein